MSSTTVRGSRSATAPPTSRNSSIGMLLAAATKLRSRTLPDARSTATGSATDAIAPPNSDTLCPTKNQRNVGRRHGFMASAEGGAARSSGKSNTPSGAWKGNMAQVVGGAAAPMPLTLAVSFVFFIGMTKHRAAI